MHIFRLDYTAVHTVQLTFGIRQLVSTTWSAK